MRFLKELFTPKLRCDRLGHKLKSRRAILSKGPDEIMFETSTEYEADIDYCSRCGFRSEPRNEKKIAAFNSTSWPSRWWDDIREKGYKFNRWAPTPPAGGE